MNFNIWLALKRKIYKTHVCKMEEKKIHEGCWALLTFILNLFYKEKYFFTDIFQKTLKVILFFYAEIRPWKFASAFYSKNFWKKQRKSVGTASIIYLNLWGVDLSGCVSVPMFFVCCTWRLWMSVAACIRSRFLHAFH